MEIKKPYRELPWGMQPGVQKTAGKIKVRKKSLAVQILKGIGLAGMLLVAASNPYFGRNLISAFNKDFNRRKFLKSLNYLKSRGYVRILSNNAKGMKIEITRAGERVVKFVDVADIKLSVAKTWDGKWRVIIFDIPNYKSKNRAAFREKIKNLGFRLVQKSVWVYPHEAREAIMILRKFYDIEKYVTYMETTHSEDEDLWLRIFRMEDKGTK